MKIDLLLEEKEFAQVFNSVVLSENGLKLIGHLISRSLSSNDSFLGNSRDAYNKGRSEIGFELVEALQVYSFDRLLELFRMDNHERLKELEKINKKRKVQDND